MRDRFQAGWYQRDVDHIVPARLIRRLRAGNPDRRENLQCICKISCPTAANFRLTTSYVWAINLVTWRFFGPTILILRASSGHWRFTVSKTSYDCRISKALA